MNNKGILTTALCLSVMTSTMAQSITGKVVDTKGEPLAFANVVLLNRQDSAFVKGAVSGEDGSFSIDSVCNGGIIKVTSVGYKTICKDCEGENVGVIKMEEDSKMLGEVVVKSSRPVIAIKGNALVTTVVNSQLSHAGTANDVLRQVPMVTGRDGNFEVFGKGTPLIYINGRLVQDKMNLHSSIHRTSRMLKSLQILVPSMMPPSSLSSAFAPSCHKVTALVEHFVRKMASATIFRAWSKLT